MEFLRGELSVPIADMSSSSSSSKGFASKGFSRDLGAGFFRQNIVRAPPGPLVTPHRFAFSCQSLRICGCLDFDDGKGRRDLAIIEP